MSIQLDTVYAVSRKTTRWDVNRIHRGLLPTLYIDAGKVDIYISNKKERPTDHTEMIHDDDDVLEAGKIYKLNAMFKWILFKQAEGATTSIETEGLIEIEE